MINFIYIAHLKTMCGSTSRKGYPGKQQASQAKQVWIQILPQEH